jgi:peptide/nickel transport system permease protein
MRRVGTALLVLLGVSVVTFTLARVVPSDPAALYIGPHPRPEDLVRITEQLGLNKPLPVQYVVYLSGVLRGDLGDSIASKLPVLSEVGQRVPASLELLLTAMLLAVLVGTLLGVLSARWRGRPPDAIVRLASIAGVSLPAFWLGLLLQVLFFRQLHWLPLSGRLDTDLRFLAPITHITGFYLIDSAVSGNWRAFTDVARHLVLPAVTLAAYPIGLIARMTRASMLEALSQDYVRTARAFGLSERAVYYRLALRNALPPTLTVIGLTLAYSLTGTFFVEIVFNWPGLGQFAVHSLLSVDYPAIMGITLLGAIGYVVINLLVDLLQAWLDPRVRLA